MHEEEVEEGGLKDQGRNLSRRWYSLPSLNLMMF